MAKHMKSLAEFKAFAASRGYTVIFEAAELDEGLECIGKALGEGYAGVYMQMRTSGQLYVGQAEDIVRRQKQHAKKNVRLAGFAVKPVRDRIERDRTEAREIWLTAQAGYALENVQLVNQKKEDEPLSDAYIDRRLGHMLAAACPLGRGARFSDALAGEGAGEVLRLLARPEFLEAAYVIGLYCSIAITRGADAFYGSLWGVEALSEGTVTGPWLQVRIRSGEALRIDLVHGGKRNLEPRYFLADLVPEDAEDDPPAATLAEALDVLSGRAEQMRLLLGAARREEAYKVPNSPFCSLLPLALFR